MIYGVGDKVRYVSDQSPDDMNKLEGVVTGYMLRIEPYEGGSWTRKGTWCAVTENAVELIEKATIEI